ncbi:MAG: hypothetical protein KatS3mg108_1102 [Isosphaeraceae bacterium]|jgi:hypothetical protein|nr:MAG: hypothetical protein KatS3mg108_1102 [Isosphaeraceae bacterium]
MSHPLERRLATLRRQVRRLLALHGLGIVVAGLLASVLFACLLDWLFHLSREIRALLLVGIVGLTTWLLVRHVFIPLLIRFRDLDVALRIEQRWPGLQDRLATTVQFLGLRGRGPEIEARFGSSELREETIRRTLSEVESIDFREVVDPRPARQAVLIAALPVVVGLLLLGLAPGLCLIALDRLVRPLGPTQWPRQTHLVVIEPRSDTPRLAKGDPFRLEVGVAPGEAIPESGEVIYRFANGEVLTRRLGTRLGGAQANEPDRLTDRLAEVNQSFTFTVRAGDDETLPRAVEVIPPPALTHARALLTPPPHTGEPPSWIEPLGARVAPSATFALDRVVEGSIVEIQATASKPLATVTLDATAQAPWNPHPASPSDSASPTASVSPASQPEVSLEDTGLQLVARFTALSSGTFAFSLKDREGFTSRPREAVRFAVDALADTPPSIHFEEPTSNRDVTAQALVPVRLQATDDFGLTRIQLEIEVASAGSSEFVARDPLPLWSPASDEAPHTVRERSLEQTLDLSSLQLQPGMVVTIQGVAYDNDGRLGPKPGRSRTIQLRILDEPKIAEQLDERRRAIREEIARILEMQRQALRTVGDTRRALEQDAQLRDEQRDAVRNAGSLQRQVTSRVADPAEGLRGKVERFLDDQANLRLANPDARDQMERIRQAVARVETEHLNPAEQHLTRAIAALEEPSRPNSLDSDATPPAETTADANRASPDSRSLLDPNRPRPPSARPDAPQPPTDASTPRPADAAPSGDTSRPSTSAPPGRPTARPGDAANPPSAPEPSGPRDRAATADLAQAADNQSAIADELQRMLDSLGEFETYRGMVREAKNLLNEQREAAQAADKIADENDLEGKSLDALSPEQRADLANAAARQSAVGDDLRRLESKLDEVARGLETADPLAAAALREAAANSRRRQTASKAGQAGQELANNQLGRARQSQQDVEQGLKKLVDELQNRRANEIARLVQELQNAEAALEDLRQRQAENRRNTARAARNPDPQARAEELRKLAREQRQIESELRRQLQKLQKLRADAAARSGQRVAERMTKAAQNQEADDADDAQDEQDQALAQLEQMQDELEQARRDAEEQLAMEQLSRIQDDLANLAQRHDELVAQTEPYGKLAREGALTRAQRRSVVGLGRAQDALRAEADDLAGSLDAAPVFSLTLKRAADSLRTATESLRRGDPSPEALLAQQAAARRFHQLLDALKSDPNAAGGQAGGEGGGGAGGAGGGGGDGIPAVAQLKLLKALQEEINERTEALDLLRQRGKTLSPEQQAEFARLESEQREVGDLVRDLTRPRRPDGEE